MMTWVEITVLSNSSRATPSVFSSKSPPAKRAPSGCGPVNVSPTVKSVQGPSQKSIEREYCMSQMHLSVNSFPDKGK